MRTDMAKVIVERPRKGGYNSRKGRLDNIDLEDLPLKEGIKRPHIGNEKELNENLKPLERFLMKNCNRPWDKVFAEISENIRLTNTVQRHVLQHLDWMIEKNAFVGKDGKAWFHNSLGWGGGTAESPIKDSLREFYVCPKSKLLRFNKESRSWNSWNRKDRKKTNPNHHKVSADEQFVKLDGIWYAVEFRRYSIDKHNKYVQDYVMSKLMKGQYGRHFDELGLHEPASVDRFWGTKGFAAMKGKQLSGKELKKLGLKNDGQEG